MDKGPGLQQRATGLPGTAQRQRMEHGRKGSRERPPASRTVQHTRLSQLLRQKGDFPDIRYK